LENNKITWRGKKRGEGAGIIIHDFMKITKSNWRFKNIKEIIYVSHK